MEPLIVLALVAVYTRWRGWNWLRAPIAYVCTKVTDGVCEIAGDLDVRVTSHPRLRIGAWSITEFRGDTVML